MENRKIFGTNLYVSFAGLILREDGTEVKTWLARGFYVFQYKRKTYQVHRVVAEYFIKYSKHRIIHLDGDRRNNAAWNLEYLLK